MNKLSDDFVVALFMSLFSAVAALFLFMLAFRMICGIVEEPLFYCILLALGATMFFLVGLGFILVIYVCVRYILHYKD